MMSLRRPGMILFTFLLGLYLPLAAQDGHRDRQRTDTAVSDTVVVGSEQGSESSSRSGSVYETGIDTSGQRGDSIVARTVPDSVVGVWKKAPDFAYANDSRYWKPAPEENHSLRNWSIRLLSSEGFRYFIYIVLGGLLFYAITRIVTENQLGIFYRRGSKRTSGGPAARDDGPADEEDLDSRLQNSLEKREYRQVIRYSYLRSLHLLDKRGLIRYHGQATNQEYLRELSGTEQEAPFRFLTYAYEKVWYGEFGLSEETFRRLFVYFTEFDKTIQG
jgi:hypothetical protein